MMLRRKFIREIFSAGINELEDKNNKKVKPSTIDMAKRAKKALESVIRIL